ncbi:hypothetical protein BDV06DRAFT_224224 [Aspergillus oleicola]
MSLNATHLQEAYADDALLFLYGTEYIDAEKCLMAHAELLGSVPDARNLWDELHNLHISQGSSAHYVGHFLPWHRYLVRTHEVLLQSVCGYTGAQPYWDELSDYESGLLEDAAIFDTETGFGGNGQGDDRCVTDGPFANTTLHIRARAENADYCLSREFSQDNFGWANASNIAQCFALEMYRDAWACYNMYPHSAGHAAVGGVMFDPTESNGDPIFYLHHAYLDRLWWQWQRADLPTRLSDMGGPNVPPQEIFDLAGIRAPGNVEGINEGDPGNETTLGHVLSMNGLVPDVTVADVMRLEGEVICAEYL